MDDERDLPRLLEAALQADAHFGRSRIALETARGEENRARCAAVNAWNAFHKALEHRTREGMSCFESSDFGRAIRKER